MSSKKQTKNIVSQHHPQQQHRTVASKLKFTATMPQHFESDEQSSQQQEISEEQKFQQSKDQSKQQSMEVSGQDQGSQQNENQDNQDNQQENSGEENSQKQQREQNNKKSQQRDQNDKSQQEEQQEEKQDNQQDNQQDEGQDQEVQSNSQEKKDINNKDSQANNLDPSLQIRIQNSGAIPTQIQSAIVEQYNNRPSFIEIQSSRPFLTINSQQPRENYQQSYVDRQANVQQTLIAPSYAQQQLVSNSCVIVNKQMELQNNLPNESQINNLSYGQGQTIPADQIQLQQKQIKKQLQQLQIEQSKNDQKRKKSKKNKNAPSVSSQRIKEEQNKLSQQNRGDHNLLQTQEDQNKKEQQQNMELQGLIARAQEEINRTQQAIPQDELNLFYQYIHPYMSCVGIQVIAQFLQKKSNYKASQASQWATQISSQILLKVYMTEIQAHDSQGQQNNAQAYTDQLQTIILRNKFYNKVQAGLDQMAREQNIRKIRLSKIYKLIKTFKTVASCIILQKKLTVSTNLNISTSCFWNKNRDGQINFSYEGTHCYVMVTLYGVENKDSDK